MEGVLLPPLLLGARQNMEKYDLTGTTPKSKVRRYIQAQEAMLGFKRKRIVDKQCTEIQLQIHHHGLHA